MAKKKNKPTAKEVVVEQEVVEVIEQEVEVLEQPVVEKPIIKTPKVKNNDNPEYNWEIKDRMYYLKNNKSRLTYLIRGSGIYYFDEAKGYERELKYTSNQRTCFVDEMKGDQRLEHIVFQNGSLYVPKNKTVLQKMLSLYHPHNGTLFEEHKPIEVAENQIDLLELEIEALNAARSLDIDLVEAVMRVEIGSRVSKMSSKELRRDVILYAKRNPSVFLELVNDDNVQLRNFGIKAAEAGIIKISSDQRYFMWGSNNRKLMTVPFDEHPYTALAHWFKTDEGMEVYTNIEKRLS